MFHPSKPAAVLLLSLALIAVTQVNSLQGGCGSNCPNDGQINCVAAQGSRSEKSVQPASSFHALQAEGCLDVQVRQGSDGVRIEADQAFLPYLQAPVEDGTLKLKIKNGTFLVCPRAGCNIKVFVSAQYLDEIQVRGSTKLVTLSNFESRDNFVAEVHGDGNLTLTAQAPNTIGLTVAGSGKLASRINSNANHIEAQVQGSGNVLVSGAGTAAVQSADYRVMGSGRVDGRALPAQTAKATIFGDSDIWVRVSVHLEAKIFGSGTVRYFGNPTVVKHIHGSGHVIQQT